MVSRTSVGKLVRTEPGLNHLLAALDANEFNVFMADAKIVSFKLNKRLYRQDAPVDFVYFPLSCMISVLGGPGDRDLVETATIGCEGVAGAFEATLNQVAVGPYIVQLPGAAVRFDAPVFREHLSNLPNLKFAVQRHQYALTRQVFYNAACNRLHSMVQRTARCLLMAHDRAGSDTFPLTQEFLSNMLAVRRATVNLATGVLKKSGLVRFVRGLVTVLDRPGLESASCACYAAVCRAYLHVGILSK